MPKGKCKMSKVTDKEMFEMLGMFISGKSVTEISKATGKTQLSLSEKPEKRKSRVCLS